MSLLVRPRLDRTFFKIIAAIVGVLFVIALAATLRNGSSKSATTAVVVAAFPVMLYVASRWPIVFPFGLYVFLIPFDPLLAFSGVGGTLTKLVGVAALGALGFRAVIVRRVFVPPASWVGWFAFLVLMTLSLAWSISVESTLRPLQIIASLFGLFTVAAMYPITFAELRIVRGITLAAGVGTALYGFYAFHSTKLPANPLNKHAERLILQSGHIKMDPNHYAAFFLIPMAFALSAFLTERNTVRRVAYAVMFAIMAGEISATGSRGGFLGTALLLLYVGIRSRRYIATALSVAGGLAISFAIPNVLQRFADKTQGDNSGRNEIWATGMRAFHDYWLAGSGFGTFAEAYDKYLLLSNQKEFQGWYRPAHNLIVSIAVELGVVGLVVLGFAIWTTLRQTRAIPREHPLFVYRLAVEGMLVSLLLMSMTIDLLWYKYFWLALTFNVLLVNVYAPRAFRTPATSRLTPSQPAIVRPRARARARF